MEAAPGAAEVALAAVDFQVAEDFPAEVLVVAAAEDFKKFYIPNSARKASTSSLISAAFSNSRF